MYIRLRSFVVVIDMAQPPGFERLTQEFAIRLDAEAALSALRDRYPQARVHVLETRYDPTRSEELNAYEAHVDRLYATCAMSGVWEGVYRPPAPPRESRRSS